MTDNYTPGPWTCSELEDDDYPFCYVVKSLDCTLAYVAGFDDDEEEGEENARLIAAAPELLEALEMCNSLKLNDVIKPIVRAAIAKAKGSSNE